MKRIFSIMLALVVLSMFGCSAGIEQGDSISEGTEVVGGNFKDGDVVDDPNDFYFEYTFEKPVNQDTVTSDTFYIESYDPDEELSQAEVLEGVISFPESDKARMIPNSPPELGNFLVLTLEAEIKYADGTSLGERQRYSIQVISSTDFYDGEVCSKPLWDGMSEMDGEEAREYAFTLQQMIDAFGPEGYAYPFLTEDNLVCIARAVQISLYNAESDDRCIDGEYYLAAFDTCGINTDEGGEGGAASCDNLTMVADCQNVVDRDECESSYARVAGGLYTAPCYYNTGTGEDGQAEVEHAGCYSSWGPEDGSERLCETPYFGYSSDRDFVDADTSGDKNLSAEEMSAYKATIFGSDQAKLTLRDYAAACTANGEDETGYFLRGYPQNWHSGQIVRDGACSSVYDINMGDSAPDEQMQFRYDVEHDSIVFALPSWRDASWNMFGDPLGFGDSFSPDDFVEYSWSGVGLSMDEPSGNIMYSEDGVDKVAGRASIVRIQDGREVNGFGGDLGTGGDFGYQYMIIISMYKEVDDAGYMIGGMCDSSGSDMPIEFVFVINGDCIW